MHRRLTCVLGLLAACGNGTAIDPGRDADSVDGPGHTPGSPGLGAHAIAFHRFQSTSPTSISVGPFATASTGSTIVLSTGRGDASAFALPTDNKGNTYGQLDTTHPYTNYPGSGTAVYAVTAAAGGAGHVIQNTTPSEDEITLAAVEVLEGSQIQAAEWIEVLAGNTLTSKSVTTTGPATLVAFWWGDAGVDGDKTAIANNGFTVIDSVLPAGALVQCAVAVKSVVAPGTYDVTWTSTPVQGAQLWLIAVQ